MRPPLQREIDTSPISLCTTPPFDDPFDQAVYEAASSLLPVGRIAFDLDDTLLLNSRTLRDEWLPSPGTDRSGQELVECALLPGAIALLAGLRHAGNELALISTSSRRRIDHLRTRLPDFEFFFSTNKVTESRVSFIAGAEEIVDAQHQNLNLRPKPDSIRLTQKTPALATHLFGSPGYNLIIDDSLEVASILSEIGRDDLLLPVKTTKLNALTAWEIIRGIARFTKQSAPSVQPPEFITPPQRLPDPYFLADLCCGNVLTIDDDILEYCP